MLEWNVYVSNYNSKNIEVYNIFNHWKFLEDCVKIKKKSKNNKEEFSDKIKQSLMYYFWSKYEWEIILSHWPPTKNFNEKKIDVFSQINLNWNQFVDYLWNNKEELK